MCPAMACEFEPNLGACLVPSLFSGTFCNLAPTGSSTLSTELLLQTYSLLATALCELKGLCRIISQI